MKLIIDFSFVIILFSIINITLLERVHGRTLAPQPRLAQMIQNGQIYNCVDFYEQPAFSHPLLKAHIPKVRPNLTTSIQGRFDSAKGGCPNGTVPISSQQGETLPPQIPPPAQVHCYAIVRTNTNKKFYGSDALLNLYKPAVQGNQWSTARIKISNGPDSIEAGWMVNPSYFKDNEAHLYAKFKTGSVECLNTACPGFVQKSQNIPLGFKPDQYSTIHGQQYAWDISINKNRDDGNWWLSTTGPNSGTQQIGYWPSSLFTALGDAATMVEWGGEINDPGAVEPPPLMGTGFKAKDDSAFFQKITVVDETFNNVNPVGTEKFEDCKDLYTVKDNGDQGGNLGRVILYGGPK